MDQNHAHSFADMNGHLGGLDVPIATENTRHIWACCSDCLQMVEQGGMRGGEALACWGIACCYEHGCAVLVLHLGHGDTVGDVVWGWNAHLANAKRSRYDDCRAA